MGMDFPTIEARVRAQEGMQTILNARLEQIALDMQLSFKQSADYQLQIEHKIDALETRVESIEARVENIEARVESIEARVESIEAHMATKDDLAAMESRILGAFQQLITSLHQAGEREKA